MAVSERLTLKKTKDCNIVLIVHVCMYAFTSIDLPTG